MCKSREMSFALLGVTYQLSWSKTFNSDWCNSEPIQNAKEINEDKNRLKVLDLRRLHYYGLFLKKKKQGHSNLHTPHIDAKKIKNNSRNCSKRDSDLTPRKKFSTSENNEALDFFGRGCEFSTTEQPKKVLANIKKSRRWFCLSVEKTREIFLFKILDYTQFLEPSLSNTNPLYLLPVVLRDGWKDPYLLMNNFFTSSW